MSTDGAAGTESNPRMGELRTSVAAVCVLGAALALFAISNLDDRRPGSWTTLGVLLAIATGIQVFRVRFRRDGVEESITLFETSIVASALLLAPTQVLAISFVAVLIPELVRRHPPVKVLFNLGSYTGATALFLLLYHAVAGPLDELVRDTGNFPLRVTLALLAGQAGFVLFNSLTLQRILYLASGEHTSNAFLRTAPLNLMLLVGNVALGSLGVLVWLDAPSLLPLLLAAVIITIVILREASRTVAVESRSSQLNSLVALIGRDGTSDPLPALFRLIQRTFEADEVFAITETPTGATTTYLSPDGERQERPSTPEEACLLELSKEEMTAPITSDLPLGWRRALVAPFETPLGGRAVLALGFSLDSRAIPSPQDVPLLFTLAAAVRVSAQSSLLFGHLSAVTSSQTEAVLTVSEDGVVSFLNPAASRLLGAPQESTVGRPISDVLSVRAAGVPVDLSALAHSRSTAEEVHLVPLDVSGLASSAPLVVDCSAAPLGDSSGYVLVLRDVSERVSSRTRLAETENALLRLGRTLQASLLPPSLPEHPRASLAARYLPASEGLDVGGDFYDVYTHSDDAWSLVVGDVCGRGPEAAALTAMTRYSLRAAAVHVLPPSELLETLNSAILSRDEGDEARFCTVAAAQVDFAAGTLTVSLGGHPPVLVVRSSGEVVEVGEFGAALGIIDDPGVSDHQVHLYPGDLVLLYTDGVIEARSTEGEFFEPSLYEMLPSFAGLDSEAACARLDEALAAFRAPDTSDDTAFLFLSYAAPTD